MAPASKPWFKRPFLLIGLLLLLGFLVWAGIFGAAVIQNITLIQQGKLDPVANLQAKTFAASISQSFATANVQPEDLARLETGVHPTLGNPEAPVHIVEFVDYGCPYCKQESTIIRGFMQQHMTDAELIIRDFPIVELHPSAQDAAMAADCVFAQGDINKYWSYYDRLFASQDAQAPSDLRTYAEQDGVDLAAYDQCVSSTEPAAAIQQSLDDGQAAGVQGTPTFFFNGLKIQGAIDADSLGVIVSEAAKRAAQK